MIELFKDGKKVAEMGDRDEANLKDLPVEVQADFWSDQIRAGRTWKPSGRSVCAWCKADLGERQGIPPGIISHGICSECATKFKQEPH